MKVNIKDGIECPFCNEGKIEMVGIEEVEQCKIAIYCCSECGLEIIKELHPEPNTFEELVVQTHKIWNG